VLTQDVTPGSPLRTGGMGTDNVVAVCEEGGPSDGGKTLRVLRGLGEEDSGYRDGNHVIHAPSGAGIGTSRGWGVVRLNREKYIYCPNPCRTLTIHRRVVGGWLCEACNPPLEDYS
jgi:hypothetical protein